MTERYLCLHGHFYQPPRENPWLEAIEVQDSAAPHHDWNERITAECYGPNARARIMDDAWHIVDIVNNYARTSFNVGPTLLSWLEAKRPRTYAAIIDADAESAERFQGRFQGHGSAMAQAYNHLIMPLANARDRRTQVRWGVRDFERRFGRRPEGIWLPEAAVCVDTLEALAEEGVLFTVLAPHQAKAVRPIGEDRGADEDRDADEDWQDVQGGNVDPSRAYRCPLPSGESIALFFYDGPISNAVAFEKLLERGERFKDRLMEAFDDDREHPQLVHIATDGETYGHHHARGEMALAYALRHIDDDPSVTLTNYGAYLERHPPELEVQIIEKSSWSCVHGVERWRADCGCSTGRPDWHQRWRAPLREALDWLRDAVAPGFEEALGALVEDAWAARDAYIDVIADRSADNVDHFFAERARAPLTADDRVQALRLLELQRNAMLMYTSCGWFFDELSGLETTQVMRYAARVVQLAGTVLGLDLEDAFVERLANAPSNLPRFGDGRGVYDQLCRPARIDLERVGAHHALSALFRPDHAPHDIYCYRVDQTEETRCERADARLVVGRTRVCSRITGSSQRVVYAALHLGGHDLSGGVRAEAREDDLERLRDALVPCFEHGEYSRLVRAIDQAFAGQVLTLRALFRDDQRRTLDSLLARERAKVAEAYDAIYDRAAPLLRFLSSLGQPAPLTFRRAAEVVLDNRLQRELEGDLPTAQAVRALLDEAGDMGIELDLEPLRYELGRSLTRASAALRESPDSLAMLERFGSSVRAAAAMPVEVDLWEAQNTWFALAEQRDAHDAEWCRVFDGLRETLEIRRAGEAA
jgi:alpha-amylase/alpha-mannosidase (GH57 family)